MAGVKGKTYFKGNIIVNFNFYVSFLFSALVALAFTGSIGLLFLFLACALPQFK